MTLLHNEQEALRTRAAALVLREKEYQQREKDLAQKQKHRRLLRLELIIDFHGTKRPKDFRSESRQKIE